VLRARVTRRRDLAATERAEALDAVEVVYAAAGVTRFAAWMHENDWAMRADLEGRGYTLAETTRGMGIVLDEIRGPRPEIELGATGSVQQTGMTTCASSDCHRAFSAAPITPPFTSWSYEWMTQTSRRRWRSITMAIAGSITSEP
jgi:hypothetical protein